MWRFAPYIAIAFLSVAVWGMWQRGQHLKDQRDQAQAEARSYKQVVASMKAWRADVEKLRERYEESERKLRAIPDDGCLDKRVPDDLRGLFNKPSGKDRPADTGAEEGAADGR